FHRLPPASGAFLFLARRSRGRRYAATAGTGAHRVALFALFGLLGAAAAKQGADAARPIGSRIAVGTTSSAPAATAAVVGFRAGGGRHGRPDRPLYEVLLAHRPGVGRDP